MTAPAPAIPVVEEGDPLVTLRRYEQLAAPPTLPPGALDPDVSAAIRTLDADGDLHADEAIHRLRRAVPDQLCRVAAQFEPTIAGLAHQLATVPGNDQSVGAQAHRYVLGQQLERERARYAEALREVADAQRAELRALDRQQQGLEATDADAPVLDGPTRLQLDDVLALLPRVHPDEQVALLEGVVHRVARSAITASARGLLRHVASLARSLAREPTFDRIASASSDRGARLATLLYAVERMGRDPRVVGAGRARRHLGRAAYELSLLERALREAVGPDPSWSRFALDPASRTFRVLQVEPIEEV